MTPRRVLPLALAPLLAAFAACALFAYQTSRGADQVDAFTHAGELIVVAGAIVLALVARPAWTVSVGLALAMFSAHWGDMGVPVPVERVVLAIGVAVALAREWRARPGALRTRPIDWLLFVVSIWAIGSALLAGTLDDSQARFVLLDRFSLIAFLLFFAAPIVYREERDRRILMGTLVAMGLYLGIDAVIETTGPRGLLLPRYIDDPTVGIHFDRARGPFVEATANGLALYACAVASTMAAVTWRDRRARAFAVLVTVLCMLGTLLTVTRAIWLAAMVATLVAMFAARETRRFVGPVVIAGVALVLGAFAVVPDLAHRADKRKNDDQPLWDRRNSNAAALRMIAERPVLGFGWGRFPTDSPDYYRQTQDFPLTTVRNVHNVVLANAAELGVAATAAWLCALLWAVVGGFLRRGPPDLRLWRVGMVAVAVSWLVAAMTTPLGFTFPTLLLWAWAGILWVGKPMYGTPGRPSREH